MLYCNKIKRVFPIKCVFSIIDKLPIKMSTANHMYHKTGCAILSSTKYLIYFGHIKGYDKLKKTIQEGIAAGKKTIQEGIVAGKKTIQEGIVAGKKMQRQVMAKMGDGPHRCLLNGDGG